MAIVYEIEHITRYQYANPVTLGEHRAMFLPRGSHAERILSYSVETNVPSRLSTGLWIPFNNVAVIEFAEPIHRVLTVTCRFKGMHFGTKGIEDFPLDPRAQEIPVQYTPGRVDRSVRVSAAPRRRPRWPCGGLGQELCGRATGMSRKMS
jgi:hypothetical protein